MHKNILVIGAGRSAFSLIRYLHETAKTERWLVAICEQNQKLIAQRRAQFPNLKIHAFNVLDEAAATEEIKGYHLVISMLPASLHIHPARVCSRLGIHLITASYMTPGISELRPEFEKNGALLLMETGLDPGIDHMSAMKVLDRIKAGGARLTAFETFTGGLLADNTDNDDPWHYKFTWNPRNVVMAGTGNVKFIQEGRYKYIPYHKLFTRTEVIHIPGHGYFEGYANRDSLKYLELYKLQGIQTLYRGTLRRPGFCKAWNVLVQLGTTDDSYRMENVGDMSHRQFINAFLSFNPHDSVELKLAHYMNIGMESEEMYRLKWLGIFDDTPIGLTHGSPAQILEHILKKKWSLEPKDKDMIIMWHKFDYLHEGRSKQIQSHMVVLGEDNINTAMSKAVGLPMAMAAMLILKGDIQLKGIHIPTVKEVYEPILAEMQRSGFEFSERETL